MGISERRQQAWRGIVDPGWLRPPPTRRQRQIDVMLAGLFFGVGVVSLILMISLAGFFGSGPIPLGSQLPWLFGLSVPLAWRRRFPITVGIVVAAVFIPAGLLGYADNLIASVALFWALYTMGAWSRHRRAAFWTRVGIVIAMFGMLAVSLMQYVNSDELAGGNVWSGPLDPGIANVLYSLLVNVGYFAAAIFFGTAAWTSARREHLLRTQAEQLAAAQEIGAQQAVMRERVEIARELHDVVAHHVSVMGVQASAARRVLTKSPELASAALSSVEGTARVAITELRGLLGILRDTGSPVDPSSETQHSAPGIEQIPDLIETTRGAGLRIDYGVYGEPRPVSGSLSVSLFRIVQESLTNVIKHAVATAVTVRLRYLDTAVEVEITDNGIGLVAASRGGVGGYGLVGMRERVGVHAGTLETGPRDGGGFRVRARLAAPGVATAETTGAAEGGGQPGSEIDGAVADGPATTPDRTAAWAGSTPAHQAGP